MNTVQILGNLTRDPEVRYTNSGKAVATFNVAASNTFVDSNNETKEQTAFINCVAWGKLAESIGNLRKGNRAFVEGRLQTRSYETADGQKRYVTEVVANFVGTSLTNDDATSLTNDDATSSNFDSFEQPQDENIPF